MFKWLRRRRQDEELDDELRFHLEQQGASAARFGGLETIKEECREERTGEWVWSLLRDFRLGLRMLRRNPGFALTSVVTLGLALGANTAVYSCLSGLLLRQPPFPDPGRVVQVVSTEPGGRIANQNPTWAGEYEAYRAGAPALAALAGYTNQDFNISGMGAAPAHGNGLRVTPNFFDVFKIRPAQGRSFQSGDEHAVVLSDGTWRSVFAGRPMLGKDIRLDGQTFTVIGVMPRGFARGVYNAAVWITMRFTPAEMALDRRTAAPIMIVGRLRPGATLAQAATQVQTITQRLNAQAHMDAHGWGESVITLQAYRQSFNSPGAALAMLLGLVGAILLIACGNVAGLLLERNAARAQEFAIRRALGAPRWRLVRQLLTESSVLALLAGGMGLALGALSLRWLNAAAVASNGLVFELDPVVLALTAAATMLTVLAAGLGPALRATRLRPLRRAYGRSVFMAAEVALSLVCLTLALTLVQYVRNELQTPLGYQPRGLLSAELTLSSPKYDNSGAAVTFLQRLQEAAAALPGARAAALVSPGVQAWDQPNVQARGHTPYAHGPMIRVLAISPGYFRTMEAPLLAGRGFTQSDALGSDPVAIASLGAAQHLFPGVASPIGQFVKIARDREPPWRRIVGVAPGPALFLHDEPANRLYIFEPLLQRPAGTVAILLRAAHPEEVAAPLRTALARLDADLPIFDVEKLSTLLDEGNTILSELISALAVLALLLTAVGVYGMVAYATVRRRREAAIRLALGATTGELVRWLGWSGWRWVLGGAGAGLVLAWLDSMLLRAALPPVATQRWSLFAWPMLLVLAVTALACILPARRALRRSLLDELKQI